MNVEKYEAGCFRLTGRSLSLFDMRALLLAEANKSPLKRARICTHRSTNDVLQEMFVLMLHDSPKGTYKYATGGSAMVLDGEMKLAILDTSGVFLEEHTLTPHNPYIRFDAGVWMRPKIMSDYVLLHETHVGPWTKQYVTPWITKEMAEMMEAG